jgi:hypothetical protein
LGSRLAAQSITLECPRCAQPAEHQLATLQESGEMTCVDCGGSFAVDRRRLERMSAALRHVDSMLGAWGRGSPSE